MSLIKLHEFQTKSKVAKVTSSLVVKVTHSQTQQVFALKKITRQDFFKHHSDLMELMLTMKCGPHPNIIKIKGFTVEIAKINGTTNFTTYILMELWPRSLLDEISFRFSHLKYFNQKELNDIIPKLIHTFAFLQKKCIAHRDIKPENILINEQNNICVIDFSESIKIDQIKTQATTLVGSPYYMSPELKYFYINGFFSPIEEYNPWKSDVFSLGMTLIDLCSLNLGDQKNLREKMDIIKEVYGEKLQNALKEMIKEKPEERPDFIEMENSLFFWQALKSIKEINCEKKHTQEKETQSQKSTEVKKKIYGFFEKLFHNQRINEVFFYFFVFKMQFFFIG